MPSRPPVTTLAYLLSEYPLLEHTYLLREVRRLRELGWNIQTISIRRPEDRQLPKSKVEEEEQSATWYILDGGISNHLVCHIATFGRALYAIFAGSQPPGSSEDPIPRASCSLQRTSARPLRLVTSCVPPVYATSIPYIPPLSLCCLPVFSMCAFR